MHEINVVSKTVDDSNKKLVAFTASDTTKNKIKNINNRAQKIKI